MRSRFDGKHKYAFNPIISFQSYIAKKFRGIRRVELRGMWLNDNIVASFGNLRNRIVISAHYLRAFLSHQKQNKTSK